MQAGFELMIHLDLQAVGHQAGLVVFFSSKFHVTEVEGEGRKGGEMGRRYGFSTQWNANTHCRSVKDNERGMYACAGGRQSWGACGGRHD